MLSIAPKLLPLKSSQHHYHFNLPLKNEHLIISCHEKKFTQMTRLIWPLLTLIKLTNPHFLALMSPEENSMQSNQLFVSNDSELKCMKMLEWFLALSPHILYCTLKSCNLGNECTHILRTWYCFSIHGPCKEVRPSLALWASKVTYTFYCINFMYHLSPLNWGF